MLYIGNHTSSSRGYLAMGKQMLANGGNTFAFFTRNPRGGKAKEIDPADVEKFLELAREHHFGKIVAHAPYTMNACAAKENLRDFAREIMADDLKRMEYTPGNYYNFHPGSHVKQGVEIGIDYITQMLNEVLKPEQTTKVLLETMAGKGSEIGRSFEELRAIIDRVELNDHLGVCLASCHVYDAGYDIVNDLDGVLKQFDEIIGIDRLYAIHINDSKNPFESHKDRHEKIGEGSIGTEAFERIINHPMLADKPFFLETPNELDGFAKDIALLKSLRRE